MHGVDLNWMEHFSEYCSEEMLTEQSGKTLFEDSAHGRSCHGNYKGNAEGVVGYARRNFMAALHRVASWDAFNGRLEEQCRNRSMATSCAATARPTGERFVPDREASKTCLCRSTRSKRAIKHGLRGPARCPWCATGRMTIPCPIANGHQEVWIRGVCPRCGYRLRRQRLITQARTLYVRPGRYWGWILIQYLSTPWSSRSVPSLCACRRLSGWELH